MDSEFDLLMIGVEEASAKELDTYSEGLRVLKLNDSAEVESLLESTELAPESLVVVSTATKGLTHLEVGQALSSAFVGIHSIFVTSDRKQFELATLSKNGFTEVFLLPMDSARLEERLLNYKVAKVGGVFRKYRAVKLVDIEADMELPFELMTFLPLNRKYVKLTTGGKLSEKKCKALKEKNINAVYIDAAQLNAFYDFTAAQMVKLGVSADNAVSETQRAEKLQSNVRELFRSFLDTSEADLGQGRDLLEQSKKVVESFVIKKTGIDLRKTLQSIVGATGDGYSHAQSVSTIASLLSMATGVGAPEELAIAGLFHDIGMHGLRDGISIFDLPDLTPEEREIFLNHPRVSLSLLREKRVTLVPIIAEMLEKHHERVDGKGFPAQLQAHKIPLEAQLLAYSDAFEHLSRPKAGVAAMKPAEIHQRISIELGLSLELLQRIEGFLMSATTEPSTPVQSA